MFLPVCAAAQVLGYLFIVVKWLGGAYLFWLGWKMWTAKPDIRENEDRRVRPGKGSSFLGGLLVPFSNPKVILFYVSLLPSFVDLSRLNWSGGVSAAGLIALALTAVLSVYAYTASRMRHLFTSCRAAKNLNRGAGAAMMGTGVMIAMRPD